MSLLPALNASRTVGQEDPEYYFALSGGNAGPVTDSSFVATGLGVPPNGGSFTAISEAVNANPTSAFVITDLSGVPRWAMGVANAETGANVGSDFVLSAFTDNGGVISPPPLSVNRASGEVSVNTGLSVDGLLTVSNGINLIGGDLVVAAGDVDITGGLTVNTVQVLVSQQDFISTQSVALAASYPAGTTAPINVGAVFQVPKTGMYILTGLLSYNGSATNTFTCTYGDNYSLLLVPQPVGSGLQGGVFADLSPIVAANGDADRVWENASTVKLTGLINYQAELFITSSAGIAATGGAALNATYDLVALCS